MDVGSTGRLCNNYCETGEYIVFKDVNSKLCRSIYRTNNSRNQCLRLHSVFFMLENIFENSREHFSQLVVRYVMDMR